MKGIGTRRVRVAAVAAAMLCFLAANNNVDGTSLFTHYSGQACEDSSSEVMNCIMTDLILSSVAIVGAQ